MKTNYNVEIVSLKCLEHSTSDDCLLRLSAIQQYQTVDSMPCGNSRKFISAGAGKTSFGSWGRKCPVAQVRERTGAGQN